MVTLFVSLAVMMVAGIPIAICLALSSLLFLATSDMAPVVQGTYRMVAGIDSFPLLAVPFFIYAGALMNEGGITHRIFEFAKACVGWMRGGLGYVNVGSSVIFAGMSGTALADAGGLGMIEIQAMRDAGYDDEFSIGITAASSTLGPIIPPSLAMVIYGVVASTSIGQLFAAGFIPGIIAALGLCAMVYWYARRRGYKRDIVFSVRYLWESSKRAFLSLMTPVIILGGILSGVYTPTEAAIGATVYAMFLGSVIYRTLTWKRFIRITFETAETTAVIMFIVAGASIFSWVLTANNIAQVCTDLMFQITDNKYLLLILINVILLIVGCFIDTIGAILIMTPILLPIATGLGMSPVQFGVIMVLNLNIGLLTPPVGVVLYVTGRVAKVPFETVVKATMPFLVPLVAILVLLTFVPQLSLWLPTLIYGK